MTDPHLRTDSVDAANRDEPGERILCISDDIGHSLTRLMRLMKSIAQQSAKAGVDRSVYLVLDILSAEGPQRAGFLAEVLHADPSTVSRQVAELVRQGLVERRADPTDGRVSVLAITEAGVRLYQAIARRRNLSIAHALRAWPEEDQRRFAELFERFITDYAAQYPRLVADLLAELTTDVTTTREK